ncbi:MAG TPA: TIGR00725 family protein [Fervidobacterium sp.]|nr:TIGR00725 family protein [Fervidobacterium sp.]
MSLKVGVIGYSGNIENEPVKSLIDVCLELGERLGEKYVVFTGGRDGIMELVSKGVRNVGGTCIGILPWEGSDANEYNSLVISTGLDFQMRSFVLVKSVDVVIAIGGEIGTAVEMLATYANRKPLILLRNTGGWADKIPSVLIDDKYLDNRRMAPVYQAFSIEQVMTILDELENIDK